MTPAARAIWFAVGITALAMGGLGVLLPLLPTTPFVLLAAFAFAKSSAWLLDHDVFGTLITDWRRYRAISLRAKIAGVASMAVVLVVSLLLSVPGPVVAVQAVILLVCALFIVSRPPPPNRESIDAQPPD